MGGGRHGVLSHTNTRELPGRGVSEFVSRSLARMQRVSCISRLLHFGDSMELCPRRTLANSYRAQRMRAHFGLAPPRQAVSGRPSGYLHGTSMGCKSFSGGKFMQVPHTNKARSARRALAHLSLVAIPVLHQEGRKSS